MAAVWDPAHNALEGMNSDSALDVLAPHLCVVNLKNAYWRRISGPEAEVAEWKIYWTSGAQGRASWPQGDRQTQSEIGYQRSDLLFGRVQR